MRPSVFRPEVKPASAARCLAETYSKLKEKSDALYLDMARRQLPGITRDGALRVLEGQYTAFRQQTASVPEAVSPNNCAQMPGRFTDGTFDPAQRIPDAYQRVNSHLSP